MGTEANLEKPGLSGWRNQATKLQPQSQRALPANAALGVFSSAGVTYSRSAASLPSYRGVAGKGAIIFQLDQRR